MIYCEKCCKPFKELAFYALMIDFGARSSVSPLECSAGGEHRFVSKDEEAKAEEEAEAHVD